MTKTPIDSHNPEEERLDSNGKLLRGLPGPPSSIWAVASALEIARKLPGEHRRQACLLIGTRLTASRTLLDVATTLAEELLHERADSDAIELLAGLALAFGDYQRARVLRKLKAEAPEAPSEADLIGAELHRLEPLWNRQQALGLSPMERFAKEIEMLKRLNSKVTGKPPGRSGKPRPPTTRRKRASGR